MEWGLLVFFALAIALIVFRRQFDKAVTPALKKVGEAGDKLHDAIDEAAEKAGDALEEARDRVVERMKK